MHFTITALKNVVRYTGEFVKKGFSLLYRGCTCIYLCFKQIEFY